VLKRYVAQFDPSIIALRGSPDELAAVYQANHVDVIKDEEAAGSSGYQVGHSALVYVIDKGGLWRENLDSDSTVQDIVSAVRQLITE
jgi:protein SCO1/2